MFAFIVFILMFLPNIHGTELKNYEENLNNNKSEIVAKVGDIEITKEEFLSNYEFGPSFTKKLKNSKEKHLNYMLNEKLFALEASSIGLDTLALVKNNLTAISSDLATEELYKDEVIGNVKILKKDVDSVVVRKSIDVKVKWLFSKSESEIKSIYLELKNGIPFDTLFFKRYNTKLETNDKELLTTRYLLGKKNPGLGKIVDTLESKNYSSPIFVEDGWYIIYLESFNQQTILTETDFTRLKTEATNAVKKQKMDSISDEYVKKIMLNNEPIINSTTFRILRSYISNLTLDKELYEKWQLSKKMKIALSELDEKDKSDISALVLVSSKSSNVTIGQFLEWFWLRDQYIKFDKSSIKAYSFSLRDIVFRMVRDKLLTDVAREKGYFELSVVKKQLAWWHEKILSSAYKNYIKSTININLDEVRTRKDDEKKVTQKFEKEYNSKLFRAVQNLKKKYSISINHNALNSIHVSDEEDPKAINLYTVKKGGLIPRTPYPTIDREWANWE